MQYNTYDTIQCNTIQDNTTHIHMEYSKSHTDTIPSQYNTMCMASRRSARRRICVYAHICTLEQALKLYIYVMYTCIYVEVPRVYACIYIYIYMYA